MAAQVAPTVILPPYVRRASSVGATADISPGATLDIGPLSKTPRSLLSSAGAAVPTKGQTWPRGNKLG
jgi:hypothetical protein